jgi:hypothetical protein
MTPECLFVERGKSGWCGDPATHVITLSAMNLSDTPTCRKHAEDMREAAERNGDYCEIHEVSWKLAKRYL